MPADPRDEATPDLNSKPARRALPLSWHLVLLLSGALLPLVAFAGLVVYRLADSERAASERRLVRSARDLAQALDRELQSTIRTLVALAESEELDRDDLAAFYARAARVRTTQPAWLAVILLRPDGQQVVNTDAPWGTQLPVALDPESLAPVLERRGPAVGSALRGRLRPVLGFPVRVPVVRGGGVRYVLTAVIDTGALADEVGLSGQQNGEWTRTIVDARGVVVARGREPERFVGERLRPEPFRRIQEAEEGLIRETALEGAPVYIAFSRDPLSKWTAAVAVPVEALDAPARSSTLSVVGLGLALLSLSTAGAFLLSRHVSRGLGEAAAAAETMSRGGSPRPVSSSVKEVAQLGRSLAHSAALLTRHERDRDEHLARADAARAEAVEARRAQESLLEELRQSRARLQLIADRAPVSITYCGSDGTYRFVNKTYAERLGLKPSDIVGRSPGEVLGAGAAAAIEPYVAAALRGERVEFETEVPYQGIGPRHMWVAYEPEFDERGRVTGFVSAILDVTEQKRGAREREELLNREQAARRQAEEANRLKDDFLATVSHELRTPLTSIMGWAHILETTPPESDTARQAVKVIRRNADQQRQIIDDILDVSRIITGKLRLEAERVELAPVVQAALESVKPAADARGIRLRTSFDPTAWVTGDPHRLQQVVWNLLANAVKFTPKGGEVRVAAERILTHVRVEVSDTGQGISAEFLPYVFDRFRQADSSHTRKHGGLGLGLAIVRHLVELHGGSVHAYSAGEGQGSTFTVDLPLPLGAGKPGGRAPLGAERAEAGAAVTRPAAKDSEAPPPLVGLRVLLADDDADTLDMLSMLLRRCGAEVTAAASAEEALAALARTRLDVIVADIAMPVVDGHELMRRVRALGDEQGGRTPSVALTAYAGDADRARALRAGYQAYLTKPVAPDTLISTLANLVGRAASREA